MSNKSKSKKKLVKKSSYSCTDFSVAEEVYARDPETILKYKKQKEVQGFDDTETWHLDRTLALFLMPRLERFIQVNNGFPTGETEDSYNEKLNFIVHSFKEYYYNEDEDVSLELEKERLLNAKKAAELLGKLWFDLWW